MVISSSRGFVRSYRRPFKRFIAAKNERNDRPPPSSAVWNTQWKSSKELFPLSSEQQKQRSELSRFLNPWVDMASVTDDGLLAMKLEAVTRTFTLVATLMCSLSAAAIFVTPEADEDHHNNSNLSPIPIKRIFGRRSTLRPHVNEDDFIRSSVDTSNLNIEVKSSQSLHGNQKPSTADIPDHVASTSLLVRWGVPADRLSDIYASCCAGCFYSSVSAVGMSAVLNAWLACTPIEGTKHFVRYHSIALCSVPGFLALSTGLAGAAVFIGLDQSRGTPVSYAGLLGTATGAILIGTTSIRGMICSYRLLSPLIRVRNS